MKYFLVILGIGWICLFCGNYEICQILYKKNQKYESTFNAITDSINVSVIQDTSLTIYQRRPSYLILQRKYESGIATKEEQYAINDFRLVLWWGLKQNIYNSCMMIDKIIMFFALASFIPYKFRLLNALAVFGFMICFSNVVDRLYFNVKKFQTNDIAMLIFAVILSTVFYYKNEKNGGGNKVVF